MTDHECTVRRIREANPVPALAALHEDDLAAVRALLDRRRGGMTTQRTEPREHRWRRPALVLGAAFVLTLIGVGTTLLLTRGGEQAPPITTTPSPSTTLPVTTTSVAATTTTEGEVVPPTAEGTWRVFTTADGLPAGHHTAVLDVGPDGTLWAALPGAMARLDGERLAVFPTDYTVTGGQPDWIVVMPDGLVMVDVITNPGLVSPTGGTLVAFDGSEWAPQTFPDGSPVRVHTWSAARLADDGALWAADVGYPRSDEFNLGRVLRFDGEVWSAWDGPALTRGGGPVRTIEITPDGTVWFVEEGTAWRQQRDRIDRFDLPTTGVMECADWVTVAADGAVWAHAGYGASRFDPGTSTWTHYGVEDGLLGPYPVFTGIPTSDGSLWLSYSASATEFCPGDPSGSADELPGYISPDNLPEDMVLFPEGVSRFDGERWTSYTASEARAAGLPMGPHGVFTGYASGHDGSTWAVTNASIHGNYLYRHDGVSWSVVETPIDIIAAAGAGVDYARFMAVTPDGTACFVAADHQVATDTQIACFQPD